MGVKQAPPRADAASEIVMWSQPVYNVFNNTYIFFLGSLAFSFNTQIR